MNFSDVSKQIIDCVKKIQTLKLKHMLRAESLMFFYPELEDLFHKGLESLKNEIKELIDEYKDLTIRQKLLEAYKENI